jgi:hypothetical protein
MVCRCSTLAALGAWLTLVSEDQRGGGGDSDRGGVRRPAALPRLIVLPRWHLHMFAVARALSVITGEQGSIHCTAVWNREHTGAESHGACGGLQGRTWPGSASAA